MSGAAEVSSRTAPALSSWKKTQSNDYNCSNEEAVQDHDSKIIKVNQSKLIVSTFITDLFTLAINNREEFFF